MTDKEQIWQHAYDWARGQALSDPEARSYADYYGQTNWTPPHYTPHPLALADWHKFRTMLETGR